MEDVSVSLPNNKLSIDNTSFISHLFIIDKTSTISHHFICINCMENHSLLLLCVKCNFKDHIMSIHQTEASTFLTCRKLCQKLNDNKVIFWHSKFSSLSIKLSNYDLEFLDHCHFKFLTTIL